MLEVQEQIVRLVYNSDCTFFELISALHPNDGTKFRKYLADLKNEKYIWFSGAKLQMKTVIKIDIKGEKFIESRDKEIETAKLQKQISLQKIESAKKESAEAKKNAKIANLIAAISAGVTLLNFFYNIINFF